MEKYIVLVICAICFIEQGWADVQTTTTYGTYTINDIIASTMELTDVARVAVETNTLNNNNVNNFVNNVIDNAYVPDDASSSFVSVKLKAAVTSTTEFTTGTTVVTGMTFDVTPEYISSNDIETPCNTIYRYITFRLPIDKNVNAASVEVFQNNGSSLGYFPILGDASNGKYIEVTSLTFSEFSYELSDMAGVAGTVYYADNTTAYTNIVIIENQTLAQFGNICNDKAHNAVMVVGAAFKDGIDGDINVVYNDGTEDNPSYVCPFFYLTDLENFYCPCDFIAKELFYSRSHNAGYMSVCMPFAIGTAFGTPYSFSTNDANSIYMTIDSSPEAGKPYYTLTTTTNTSVYLENAEVKGKPADNDHIVGSYVKKTLADGMWKLNSSGTQFGRTSSNKGYVYPFRCYVDLTKVCAKQVLDAVFLDDMSTAVNRVELGEMLNNGVIYGAEGIRRTVLSKGLNIIKCVDGKNRKVILE